MLVGAAVCTLAKEKGKVEDVCFETQNLSRWTPAQARLLYSDSDQPWGTHLLPFVAGAFSGFNVMFRALVTLCRVLSD